MIDNTRWYLIRHNFSRGRSDYLSCGAAPREQRSNSRGVHKDKTAIAKLKQNIKTSLPASLTNSATLPGNGARKRSLMTLNVEGSIAVFSISKSVEPNEEQKVVVSDFGKEIAASTERSLFRGFSWYKRQESKNEQSKRYWRVTSGPILSW